MIAAVRTFAIAIAGAAMLTASPSAQEQLQVFLAASDAQGRPITNLRVGEVLARENGRDAAVLRLERYVWPVKVTVLVDNGLDAKDALVHYRTGLRRFFDALPGDLEVSLIATAPNPRWLVRPTSDRVQISRGIDLLTIDDTLPRSNDAFVEFAERLDDEFRTVPEARPRPYRPVLVSISTNGRDGSMVLRDPLVRMLNSFVTHAVATQIVMLSRGGAADLNDGTHVLVAKAAQELTKGRYEAIAASSRLLTLLPELGRQIAATHVRQTTQYRVTVQRPDGVSGPITDLQFSIARDGVRYVVSGDGRM